MSEPINDGAPAFPSHGSMGEIVDRGISARDYFAAKAMLLKYGRPGETVPTETMAAYCYEMADAMLRARMARAQPDWPEGWVLVPIEPTPEMLRKSVESDQGPAVFRCVASRQLDADMELAGDRYRAMLSAAPKAKGATP